MTADHRQPMLAPSMGRATSMVGSHWMLAKDGDAEVRAIFDRHYSRRRYADGRSPALFVGPGEKMVLITRDADAIFVWRKFIDKSGQQGINCAVFRNEGRILSSTLILDAEFHARLVWPEQTRLYTYVNAKRIRSSNPGCCFKHAGWLVCGKSSDRGLIILEKQTAPTLEKNP